MKTLLLVDDEQGIRFLLKSLFKREHPECTVTEAASIEEALALLRGGYAYEYVLTDLDMPHSEGLSLIAIARERLPQAKIGLMSGRMNEDLAKLARVAGADEVFCKPFGPEGRERLKTFALSS